MNSSKVDSYAQTLWDYLQLHHPLKKADIIIGFGSHDKRTAEWAAKLYVDGYAPLIIFSGNEGVGKAVSGFGGQPEAEVYRDIAISLGVPQQAILVENRSKNSSENVLFAAQLIKERNLAAAKVIVVHKPYMERRAYATIKAQWPQPQPHVTMTSMPISYKEYVADPNYSREFTINTMVGDMQRIKEYPKLGYQIVQPISDEVWQAFEELVAAGYTQHLLI